MRNSRCNTAQSGICIFIDFFKQDIIVILFGVYFFVTPLEFAINGVVPGGATLKYVGLIIAVITIIRNKVIVFKYALGLFGWLFIEMSSFLWGIQAPISMFYFTSSLNMVMFLICAESAQWTKKTIRYMLDATLYGTVLAAILMLLSSSLYSGEGIRYSMNFLGVQIDPNNAAALLLYGIPITIWRILFTKENRLTLLLCLSFVTVAVFMTGSRGGLVTLLAIVAYLTAQKALDNGLSPKTVISTILCGLLLIVLGYFLIEKFVPQNIVERIFEFESYSGGSDRTIIWNKVIQDFLHSNILFGYGVGAFQNRSIQLVGQVKGIHNTYLQILYETGIVGLLLFLASIFLILSKARKKNNSLAVALIFCGLIPSFFLDAYVKRFFWNGLILAVILLKESEKDTYS